MGKGQHTEEIARLMAIIKTMPAEDVVYIVAGLINEWGDTQPEAVAQVKEEFFQFESILAGVETADLQKICAELMPEEIAAIIDGQPEYKTRLLVALSARRREAVLLHCGQAIEHETLGKQRFLQVYDELLRKQKVVGEGLLNLFYGDQCLPQPPQLEGKAVIFSLADAYKVRQGVDLILALQGSLTGRHMELYYWRNGQKYYDEQRKYLPVKWRGIGTMTLTMPGFEQPGVYTIYFADSKSKEVLASTDIYVFADRKSALYVDVQKLETSQVSTGGSERITVQVCLSLGKGSYRGNARYLVICAACGQVIAGGAVECVDGVAEFSFKSGEHRGQYVIEWNLSSGHTGAMVLPPVWKNETTPVHDPNLKLELSTGLAYGDPLLVDALSLYPSHSGGVGLLLLVAPLQSNINRLRQALECRPFANSAPDPAEKGDSIANRRLRELVASGQIRLAPIRCDQPVIDEFLMYTGMARRREVTLFAADHERVPTKGFQSFLYRVTSDGNFALVKNQTVSFLRENRLFANLPRYIEQDENCEGIIRYYAAVPSLFSVCHKEMQQKNTVCGVGYLPILLCSDSIVQIKMTPEQGGGQSIDYQWQAAQRTTTIRSLRFVGSGDLLSVSSGRVTIYSIRHFIQEQLAAILNFSWGCAEQTSSKLGALGFHYFKLYNRSDEWSDERERSFALPEQSVENELAMLARIRDGFTHLGCFRDDKGLFQLWPAEGLVNQNHRRWVSSAIVNNLRIYERVVLHDTELQDGIQKFLGEITAGINKLERVETIYEEEQPMLSSGWSKAIDRLIAGELQVAQLPEGTNHAHAIYFGQDYSLQERRLAAEYIKRRGTVAKDGSLYFGGASIWGSSQYALLLALEMLVHEKCDSLPLLIYETVEEEVAERLNWLQHLLVRLGLCQSKKCAPIIQPEQKECEDILLTGLNQLGQSVGIGLMGSTRFSSQLILLLSKIQSQFGEAEIDCGTEVLSMGDLQEPFNTDQLSGTVLKGIGIVETIRVRNLYGDASDARILQVVVDKLKAERGDSLRITVKITGEVPFSGLLKIQMPWHLNITDRDSAQYQGGQIVEIPVFHAMTTLHASARFRGTGAIQVELSGMYSGIVAQVRSLAIVVE